MATLYALIMIRGWITQLLPAAVLSEISGRLRPGVLSDSARTTRTASSCCALERFGGLADCYRQETRFCWPVHSFSMRA